MKPKKPIDSLILTLRGQKVILDADLAELYGVPTKVFNQAVKRNADRFPEDFMFQLTAQEWSDLKSKTATSTLEAPQNEDTAPNWSQIVTASPADSFMRSQIVTASKRNIRHRPRAFTEHGAIMAATVLNSPEPASIHSRGGAHRCGLAEATSSTQETHVNYDRLSVFSVQCSVIGVQPPSLAESRTVNTDYCSLITDYWPPVTP
jgi:hypothetical protein